PADQPATDRGKSSGKLLACGVGGQAWLGRVVRGKRSCVSAAKLAETESQSFYQTAREDQEERSASGIGEREVSTSRFGELTPIAYRGVDTPRSPTATGRRYLSRSRPQARLRKPAPKPASTRQERVTMARLGARAADWSSRVSRWR